MILPIADRHQPAEVGQRTDPTEIMISAETGLLSLVEQPQKSARLAAHRIQAIELKEVLAGGSAEYRRGRPVTEAGAGQTPQGGVAQVVENDACDIKTP